MTKELSPKEREVVNLVVRGLRAINRSRMPLKTLVQGGPLMSSGRLGRRTMLPALVLVMSCACALLIAGAAFAAPSGLTVAVQKDSSDAPLYAAIAWTANPSASAYKVEKATIHSQSEARQWVTVDLATRQGQRPTVE